MRGSAYIGLDDNYVGCPMAFAGSCQIYRAWLCFLATQRRGPLRYHGPWVSWFNLVLASIAWSIAERTIVWSGLRMEDAAAMACSTLIELGTTFPLESRALVLLKTVRIWAAWSAF